MALRGEQPRPGEVAGRIGALAAVQRHHRRRARRAGRQHQLGLERDAARAGDRDRLRARGAGEHQAGEKDREVAFRHDTACGCAWHPRRGGPIGGRQPAPGEPDDRRPISPDPDAPQPARRLDAAAGRGDAALGRRPDLADLRHRRPRSQTEIAAMPGVQRVSVDRLARHVEPAARLGIPAIALFPATPAEKKIPRAVRPSTPRT